MKSEIFEKSSKCYHIDKFNELSLNKLMNNSKEILNLSNYNLFRIQKLNCSHNNFIDLQGLSESETIIYVDCSKNRIKKLDNLPSNLIQLICYSNKLTNLDNLPLSLEYLDCSDNKISYLDNLPNKLKILYCEKNNIITLDNLPNSLEKLFCGYNEINQLLNLPKKIKLVYCNTTEKISKHVEYINFHF